MTDPSDISWLRVILAFCVVLGLMAGLGGILKYINARGFMLALKEKRARRLKVVESLLLDTKHRCVIVRCDEREHLLLLGDQNDIVVEANLPPVKTQDIS
ncbi:MAG: flagellar biosynthetic protein FliO [Bdellovibrionales bacterium]|jgi:flagellar protein FliO/FliZ